MEKDTKWLELLNLLNQDEDWFKKPDTDLFKEITALGYAITNQRVQTVVDRYPEITKEKYLELEKQGLNFKEMAKYFKVTERIFREWRVSQGIKKIKRKDPLTVEIFTQLRRNGETYREIADQYNMTEAALNKWRRKHVPEEEFPYTPGLNIDKEEFLALERSDYTY